MELVKITTVELQTTNVAVIVSRRIIVVKLSQLAVDNKLII